MPAATDRIEFAPPRPPGLLRGLAFALLVHLFLVGALTWGVQWRRQSQDIAAEAELWSSIPQQAAPKEVAPPPPPPQPVVKEQPKPEPPQVTDAEIALEKQKKAAEAKKREEEIARKKEEAAKRKREEQKLALDKQKKQQQEEQKLAKLREENLQRMAGMAGASGSPSSTGPAMQSSGASPSWAGRIIARVRPNIVLTEDIAGNPVAQVEVRLAPDGTIIGRRLMKSSGSKTYDEAVLRALDKTEVLPRDIDGRVHSPVIIDFRPKG